MGGAYAPPFHFMDSYNDVVSLDTLKTHKSQLIAQQISAIETNPGREAFLSEVLDLIEYAAGPQD